MKDYKIPFRGLSLGIHRYSFEIDDRFFEITGNPEVQKGKFTVTLDLEKSESMLVLNFHIEGTAITECDRCLEELEMDIRADDKLFVKFGEPEEEESEEVVVLPETAFQIDVSSYINDFIALALPLRKVHGEEGARGQSCSREMLDRLEEHSNHQTFDPRWEKLKEIDLNGN
ncbi:MAG: DUF177 domain-containing protein [Bacteroidales bacterium]|nr:DUF177 domain-containing protein [Bacteroidales bacterium]